MFFFVSKCFINIFQQFSTPTFGDLFPRKSTNHGLFKPNHHPRCNPVASPTNQSPQPMPPAVERRVPWQRLWKHGFARHGFGTPSPPADGRWTPASQKTTNIQFRRLKYRDLRSLNMNKNTIRNEDLMI